MAIKAADKTVENKIKRKKANPSPVAQVVDMGVLNRFSPVFTNFNRENTNNEVYQSCLQTFAGYASKLKISAVRIVDGKTVHANKRLDKILQIRPNPLMNAATFWERVATFYYNNLNAFIYIDRDLVGSIRNLWAINPSSVQLGKTDEGEYIFKINLNGNQIVSDFGNVIHLARNVVGEEIFGIKSKALENVLSLININYQGLENAIKTSSFIRFIGEVPSKMSEIALTEKAERFTKDYLNISSNNPLGIAFTDSSFKIIPIQNNTQKTANFQEQKLLDERIYNFMGCPEKIVAGTNNSDEFISYYERTIEPFAIKLSQELEYKIFSDREIGFENKITVEDNRLNYLPMAIKLQMFTAARELGGINLGTLFGLLGLEVCDEKYNEIVTSQNYSAKEKESNKNDNKIEPNKEADS